MAYYVSFVTDCILLLVWGALLAQVTWRWGGERGEEEEEEEKEEEEEEEPESLIKGA
jgi:hypothetical protein